MAQQFLRLDHQFTLVSASLQIIPLRKGGADRPGNMQWQTKADSKAKDKWERK